MSTGAQTVDQPPPISQITDDPQDADGKLATLEPLAREIPNIDSAVAEIARLSAQLTLPKGTIHVISDIHGEDKKLRHIINNASGTLRPLVEKLFKDQLSPAQFSELMKLIFYPAEMTQRLEKELTDPTELTEFSRHALHCL